MPTIILIIPVNEKDKEFVFPLVSLLDPLFAILAVVDGLYVGAGVSTGAEVITAVGTGVL